MLQIQMFSPVEYPLYDGHGNMLATISRSGTSYSVGNQRAFDPWGNVRAWVSGQNWTGHPSGRYVASIGHIQDDESGLIYMRARYYEPECYLDEFQDPYNHRGPRGPSWKCLRPSGELPAQPNAN